MPEVILPCPACGSHSSEVTNAGPSFWVYCHACLGFGPIADSAYAAIEAWENLPRMSTIIAWQFQAAGAALENQKLRERVEAWEWLDEVETLYGNLGWSFDRKQCAIDELYATLVAARAAIGGI